MAETHKKTSSANQLQPNSEKIGVPFTAPQKLNSGSSATGNPRNKCALKPGHSLMDWIRLGNSGADLSGLGGRMKSVSHDELAKHNTPNDTWIAIRGKVYNITRYLDFHPGGVDELMRGAGKDATKLFEEVHAWVNYEQLLSKCLIGPYQGKVVKIDKDILQLMKQVKCNSKPSVPLLKSDVLQVPEGVSSTFTPSIEIIPRFDWIQKHSEITLYFYTSGFCNPGFFVQRESENNLLLYIFIDHIIYVYKFNLNAQVNWPPSVYKIFSETGKIEISFKKSEFELWTMYGTHINDKVKQLEDIEFPYQIEENKMFNHDSFQLSLQAQSDCLLVLPIGYHVSMTAKVNTENIKRSYTPVPHRFLYWKSLQDLNFLIKYYEHGLLSHTLRYMSSGTAVMLSQPKGELNLRSLLPHNRFALIAAGSGLTPMLSLIDQLLQRSSNRIEKLSLMLFNKTANDIWCKDVLDILQAQDERLQVEHILSQPNKEWNGATGRISSKLLEPLTKKNTDNFVSYIFLCGPSAFNQAAVNILKTMEIPDANMHIFY